MSVLIDCPLCQSTGLLGVANVSTCTYCKGTGIVPANTTDTVATADTAAQTAGAKIIVTVPTPVPAAASKVISRGK